LPRRAWRRSRAPSARSSARSVSGSVPRTWASVDEAFDILQPDLFRRSDDVAVGEHQPVRRDHDAGAEAAAHRAGFYTFGPVSTRTTAGPTRSVTPITALE